MRNSLFLPMRHTFLGPLSLCVKEILVFEVQVGIAKFSLQRCSIFSFLLQPLHKFYIIYLAGEQACKVQPPHTQCTQCNTRFPGRLQIPCYLHGSLWWTAIPSSNCFKWLKKKDCLAHKTIALGVFMKSIAFSTCIW